ncbi:hypothetical protein RRG08_000066, partial [Elysia crispata]
STSSQNSMAVSFPPNHGDVYTKPETGCGGTSTDRVSLAPD